MGGFNNHSLNVGLRQGLYEQICEFLIKCSGLMVADCTSDGNKLDNDEEKITAHLTEKYLNDFFVRSTVYSNQMPVKFINESLEKFDVKTNTFVGRVDIKAVSLNWLSCKNNNDYYTIECKRIDGKSSLNKKYITEGVARFVVPPIKYQSFHNKNIMFGYIVKKIDIIQNIKILDSIHKKELSGYIVKDMQYIPMRSNIKFCICESKYDVEAKELLLSHIFYDFSSIIS